jgi:ComF family protein
VPLHWRRRWFRGFNQAHEISKLVAKKLGVPIIDKVRRKRSTPFQSGLSARERAKNLRSAFAVSGGLCRAHVLIVDDVITTGTTMRQLASALKKAGVIKVSALAIARSG